MLVFDGLFRWRRTDGLGLEVLHLSANPAGVSIRSTVIDAGADSFAVEYEWTLDADWSTRHLGIRLLHRAVPALFIERASATTWRVNQVEAPDLNGCEEIDLSVTPFCNSVALRRFKGPPGAAMELTALYVSFPDLACTPSRQRYERLEHLVFKYVDLGANAGFEARLTVDTERIVRTYEGLFELIEDT